MKNSVLYITLFSFLAFCSCDENGGKVCSAYTEEAEIMVDSALNKSAEFYHEGNPLQQKAMLDSIAPIVNAYEDGTVCEQKLYSKYLRSKLIYFAQFTNQYDSMLHYGTKAKEYAKHLGDFKDAVVSTANLGDIYRQRGETLKAAEEYVEALMLNDSIVQSPEMYLAIYSGMAATYVVQRNLEKAEISAQSMMAWGEFMNVVDSISYYTMLGNTYYYSKRYEDCLQQFMSLDSLLRTHPELIFDRQVCNVNLADIYVQTKQNDKVGTLLDDAITYLTLNGITAYLPYIHTLQIQHLMNKGKYRDALSLADHCMAEMPGMNLDHKVTRYKVLSECMERNGRIDDAYRYYGFFDALEDSIRSTQINVITREIEQRYRYDLSLAQHKLAMKEANLREKNLWLIIESLILMLILAGGYFWYRMRKIESEKELALTKILDLRNQVIHNRITPHFISNALSLGSKLQEEEITELIELIRGSLSYEHKLTVTLDKEYELICNYVKVASYTHNGSIQIDMQKDDQIDMQKLIVPSMSLLIIVENAIKHGKATKDNILHVNLRLIKTNCGALLQIENDGALTDYYSCRNDSAMHGLQMLSQTIELTNSTVKNQKILYKLDDSKSGKVIATMEFLLTSKS